MLAENAKSFSVPEEEALKQFVLHPSDLAGLRCAERPWPTQFSPRVRLFDKEDLRTAAMNRWGSLARAEEERKRIREEQRMASRMLFTFALPILMRSELAQHWARSEPRRRRGRRSASDADRLPESKAASIRAVSAAIIGNAVVMVCVSFTVFISC